MRRYFSFPISCIAAAVVMLSLQLCVDVSADETEQILEPSVDWEVPVDAVEPSEPPSSTEESEKPDSSDTGDSELTIDVNPDYSTVPKPVAPPPAPGVKVPPSSSSSQSSISENSSEVVSESSSAVEESAKVEGIDVTDKIRLTDNILIDSENNQFIPLAAMTNMKFSLQDKIYSSELLAKIGDAVTADYTMEDTQVPGAGASDNYSANGVTGRVVEPMSYAEMMAISDGVFAVLLSTNGDRTLHA